MINTNKNLLVSIIIPTYNGSESILKAINSVLNQTYSKIEVIVVDDYSGDDTVRLVSKIKDERVKLLKHDENKGGSAARNTGTKASKGQYIAFLDDDDEWLPGKLENQIKHLEEKDSSLWKAVLCGHNIISKDHSRQVILKKEGNLTLDILLMQLSLAAGTTLIIRRDVIDEIGLFDESYVRHQDLEFLLRYLREFKIAVVGEPLVNIYRYGSHVSGDSLILIKKKFLKDFNKDIMKFGRKTSRKIFARHWLQVSKQYSLEGDVSKTIKYLFKSLSYAVLFSKRYKIMILENYIALPYHLLKGFINKYRK